MSAKKVVGTSSKKMFRRIGKFFFGFGAKNFLKFGDEFPAAWLKLKSTFAVDFFREKKFT